ncbi:MAG: 50S ribosomal protein L17 [Kiritimatiellae bacterium]|nr:50S ribosomal protein L17 [Kiritimatiellia bacterium]
MRHRKDTLKLGRTSAHVQELLGSLVCNLILARRIQTTVVKAKAARRLAERMVTLAKRNTLAARRAAIARLHRADVVGALFEQVGPAFQEKQGGYTRIVKLGQRLGDGAENALLEWVNFVPQPKAKKKDKKEKPGEKPEAKAPEKKADKKTEKKAAEKSKA